MHLWHHCDSIYYHKMTLTFEVHWFIYIKFEMKISLKSNYSNNTFIPIVLIKKCEKFDTNPLHCISFQIEIGEWKLQHFPFKSEQISSSYVIMACGKTAHFHLPHSGQTQWTVKSTFVACNITDSPMLRKWVWRWD